MIADHGLVTVHWGFWIGDRGSRIEDRGLGIGDWGSWIRVPSFVIVDPGSGFGVPSFVIVDSRFLTVHPSFVIANLSAFPFPQVTLLQIHILPQAPPTIEYLKLEKTQKLRSQKCHVKTASC